MIISFKYKFIFIKTRKTAGSAFEKLMYKHLGPKDICTGSPKDGIPRLNCENVNEHLRWVDIHRLYSMAWNDKNYYKFSLERNPWDKVVSSYHWHQLIKPENFAGLDFDRYIKTCTILPIDWMAYGGRSNLMVDDVFLYEDMWKMYEKLNEKLSIYDIEFKPEQLEAVKLKSEDQESVDYHDFHTEETIKLVEKYFKNEIKQFGYKY